MQRSGCAQVSLYHRHLPFCRRHSTASAGVDGASKQFCQKHRIHFPDPHSHAHTESQLPSPVVGSTTADLPSPPFPRKSGCCSERGKNSQDSMTAHPNPRTPRDTSLTDSHLKRQLSNRKSGGVHFKNQSPKEGLVSEGQSVMSLSDSSCRSDQMLAW